MTSCGVARAPVKYTGQSSSRLEDINLYIESFIMTDQIKKILRKKRETYNIEDHAHELTFLCYHQYEYLKDPKCCVIFMEELQLARDQSKFYVWTYVLIPAHVQKILHYLRNCTLK